MGWFCTGPLLYAAAAVAIAGWAHNFIAWARMPKPRPGARWAALGAIVAEVFLLRTVYAADRRLWLGGLLLRAGVLLGIVVAGILAVGGFGELMVQRSESFPGGWLGWTTWAVSSLAPASFTLGLGGAVSLVCLRLVDHELRRRSNPATFFHLALLAAIFGTGLWCETLVDPGLPMVRSHLATLFSGRPGIVYAPEAAWFMVLVGLGTAYLPFRRMGHIAAK